MQKELTKGLVFELDETKRLGTMRIDWYDGKLCNQWNPTELIINLNDNSEIDLGKLQRELNYVQFQLLSSFEKVEGCCGGTGYENELLFSISLEIAEYAVKLIPVKDAYSYIYAYIK